ncbi:MAG: MFS transporter [Marinobacter sp.]|nr:MFS transporter [Marinobacter sp.]
MNRNPTPSRAPLQRRWAGWLALVVLFVCGFFLRFAPATMAGSIQAELGLSVVLLGVVASMHFWAYTLAQVPAGALADHWGVRFTALFGGAVTTIGATVFALATAMPGLLAGCTLIGLGLAAVFAALMKYNAVWFPAHQHTRIMGSTMLLAAAGSIAAEGPTAHLLHETSWRHLVLGAAGSALVAFLLLMRFCQDPPLSRLSRPSHKSTGKAGFGAVIREPQIWRLLLCVGATNGTLYAFVGLWAMPLLTDSFALPHTQAAWYPTLTLVIYGLGSLLSGWLADRIQARKPLILGAALLSILVWGILAFAHWQPGWGGIALFALLGLSGAQVAVIFSATKESVALHNVGVASALVNMGAFLFAAAVQVGFGMLLGIAALAHDVMTYRPQHYQFAMLLPLAVSFLGLLAAVSVRETASSQGTVSLPANKQHQSRPQASAAAFSPRPAKPVETKAAR